MEDIDTELLFAFDDAVASEPVRRDAGRTARMAGIRAVESVLRKRMADDVPELGTHEYAQWACDS